MAKSRSISRVALLGVLLLTACSVEKGGADKPDLVLGDQAGLTRAKFEAAGSLNQPRYRFEWANFPGAAPLIEAMNAGAVDTAPAGDAPVVLAAAAGVPIRIIAATRTSGRSVAVLVPPNSPIASVRELKGHEVIVSSARGSVAQYLLLGALEEAKLPAKDVQIGFMPPGEAASAFAAGKIEAWATFGVYQATAERRGARVLRDGRGISSGLSFITTTDRVLKDPAKRVALADYLARQARANASSRAHPDVYAALYAKQTRAEPAVADIIARRENPTLIAPDAAVVKQLQRVADDFYRFGAIPRQVDIAPLVDTSLYPSH